MRIDLESIVKANVLERIDYIGMVSYFRSVEWCMRLSC